MIIQWVGNRALADAEAIAHLCKVSIRTVRRYCTPAERHDPAGPGTVQALYDLQAARAALAGVKSRRTR